MKLKILSWNIWFGTYLDKVIQYLQQSRADIICLQEVTQTPEGKNNISENIARTLGYSYVYATGMDLRPWGKPLVMGEAILSKYPIISSKTHVLSKTESRIALQADIQVANNVLHIFNTHLLHTHQQPSEIQEEQARTLISVVPKQSALVMGDFNATPDSNAIQIMGKALTQVDGNTTIPTWSVYPEGCEECKPSGVKIRLDYMFATDDLKTETFQVVESDGSDHLPISAEIDI